MLRNTAAAVLLCCCVVPRDGTLVNIKADYRQENVLGTSLVKKKIPR